MFFHKNKNSGVTAEIRIKRCYGCGAILQDQDPNEVGYLPSEKFNSDEETLCERCYKLRHYSKYKATGDCSIDYVTILSHAKEENALICYVLNCFSLEGSLLKGIGKYFSDNVLVVLNKRDLLQKNYDEEYLKKRARKLLEEENITPKEIIITSSGSKNSNIDLLKEDIEKLRNNKSVYFVGAYQVGKSSLINSLLMNFSNSTEKMITTSPSPGTTLDVISLPLDETTFLYDTPGIYNSSSIISFLEPEVVKVILPRGEVKPETYLCKEGQSFLFSNFCRFDFVEGDKTNFTFYKSNDLTLQRAKINTADSLFASLAENVNLQARTEKIHKLDDMKKYSFTALDNQPERIVIKGLGYIEFLGKGQKIDVYVPLPVEVIQEPSSL